MYFLRFFAIYNPPMQFQSMLQFTKYPSFSEAFQKHYNSSVMSRAYFGKCLISEGWGLILKFSMVFDTQLHEDYFFSLLFTKHCLSFSKYFNNYKSLYGFSSGTAGAKKSKDWPEFCLPEFCTLMDVLCFSFPGQNTLKGKRSMEKLTSK